MFLPAVIKVKNLMNKKHLTAVILILMFSIPAISQVSTIVVGVDGFTCSLCAKGVEGQFKALDFVESVVTNLKSTTFAIVPKKSAKIDFKTIREAVTDGGFTLRDITIEGKGEIQTKGKKYFLKMPDSSEIELFGLKEDISEGSTVSFKGTLRSDLKSITLSDIRGL